MEPPAPGVTSLPAELNSPDIHYVNTHMASAALWAGGHLLDNGLASGLAVQFLVVLDDPVLARTRGKESLSPQGDGPAPRSRRDL